MGEKKKRVKNKNKEKSVKKVLRKGDLANRKLKDGRDIAMDFAAKVQKKFDRIVKASILFGSNSSSKQSQATFGSDVDVILIVDDASIEWDLELLSWYREELGRLVSAQDYSKELHINTVKLTTWWNDMLNGDPVVINILRYGEALIDYGGFFNPLKALLLQGRMRSTPEAGHATLMRAPGHIVRSRISEMGAIEGAYWAMVDSAQAALMTAGKLPPSPEHIPEMLREEFVEHGMLKMGYVRAMKDLYALHKSIVHRQLANIDGKIIDGWQETAEKFLGEMTRIIDVLLGGKK